MIDYKKMAFMVYGRRYSFSLRGGEVNFALLLQAWSAVGVLWNT
jgi:hypothetical protein